MYNIYEEHTVALFLIVTKKHTVYSQKQKVAKKRENEEREHDGKIESDTKTKRKGLGKDRLK